MIFAGQPPACCCWPHGNHGRNPSCQAIPWDVCLQKSSRVAWPRGVNWKLDGAESPEDLAHAETVWNSNLLWKEDAMFRERALSLLLSIILCTTSVPKQPKGLGICLALQSCLLRSLEYILHSCAYHICIYFIYIYGVHIQHIHTNFHVSFFLKGDWIQCGFPFFEVGFWPSWCLPCCHGRRPPKIWVLLLRCVVVGAILMGRRMRENREMVGKQTRYESGYQDQLCTH